MSDTLQQKRGEQHAAAVQRDGDDEAEPQRSIRWVEMGNDAEKPLNADADQQLEEGKR